MQGLAMERRERRYPLCRALGLVSLGLGAAAFTAPRPVAELCGLDGSPAAQRALALAGVREFTSAAGLLSSRRPAAWAWTRVAGDAMDLATLGMGAATRSGKRRRRAATALAVMAGLAAIDLLAAARASRTVATADPRATAGPRVTTRDRPRPPVTDSAW